MSEKVEQLVNALLKQDEILSELLSIVVKQREALKNGRLSELQGLMSELRHVSVRCQAIETKRSRVAQELASELATEPVVSQIIPLLPREEVAGISEAAKQLMQTVEKLKLEMSILNRLMDEAKMMNEAMINEWRRLGQKAVGMMGAFDTKI